MPSKVPADFDPAWYVATYPDVALSGLNAHDHYQLFGSLLGRQYRPEANLAAAPQSSSSPHESGALAAKGDLNSSSGSERKERAAIVDRPEGFDPSAAIPAQAPRKAGSSGGSVFRLEDLASSAVDSGHSPPEVAQAVRAYSALCHIEAPGGRAGADTLLSCGSSVFQFGPARIDQAWLVGPSTMRLMLAGGVVDAAVAEPAALRAYQALPACPADLRMLGRGIQLPPSGPVFHDFELVHPLMPVLFELSNLDGSVSDFALMPFPSLLRGGMHGAELRALQTEPNPMDDFWARSDALLQEAAGGEGWPERVLTHVSVSGEGANPDWPAILQFVKEWLLGIFHISLDESGDHSALARQLVLPANSVPAISALASRGLNVVDGGAFFGAYLIADAENYRPRWSVTVPPRDSVGIANSAIPKITLGNERGARVGTVPIPLAITMRSIASEAVSTIAPQAGFHQFGPLSALLYASDASGSSKLVQSLRTTVGEGLDLLICCDESDVDLRDALDSVCGDGSGTGARYVTDLRQLGMIARHETVLTVSDRIALEDGHALATVLDLLQRHENVASASCALLAEKTVKKEAVLQPASGGLFPTGLSFVSGPRLAFGEPDVLQALPNLDYPVVANTFLFTAWRRSALAQLPRWCSTGPTNTADIRTGLELIRRGYENWCTTQAQARLSGAYLRRSQIDPVGPGYLPELGWEDILRRVTLVRELF